MAHEKDSPSEHQLSREMDEYNNTQGIRLFKENPKATLVELIQICLNAIKKGELKEIKNKKLVSTELNDEENKVPNIFLVISEKVQLVIEFITQFHSSHALIKNSYGNTALHACILSDFEEGFNILVKVIDVNQVGEFGYSVLILCSTLEYGYKYAPAIIENGTDINYQEPAYGKTALMIAASYGNKKMVEILLPLSNKQLTSFHGSTAYDLAIAEEQYDIAELLL